MVENPWNYSTSSLPLTHSLPKTPIFLKTSYGWISFDPSQKKGYYIALDLTFTPILRASATTVLAYDKLGVYEIDINFSNVG